MAGGNYGADIIGGYIGSVGTASTGLLNTATNGSAMDVGGSVSALTKVAIHIAGFWIISIGVLILLHKAGFRFSITIG